MNRTEVKSIREDLQALFEKHGLTGYDIEVGNASFTASEVTFKVTVRAEGEESSEMKDARRMADMQGMTTENADGYKITGYRFKARKMPWIVEHPDGKSYVYTTAAAKAMFKSEEV